MAARAEAAEGGESGTGKPGRSRTGAPKPAQRLPPLSRSTGHAEREATVHEAKTHLSRLLAEVEAGGSVVITRRGRPVAKLEPIRQRPVFGSMKGRIGFDESFFDPLPQDELRAWEGN